MLGRGDGSLGGGVQWERDWAPPSVGCNQQAQKRKRASRVKLRAQRSRECERGSSGGLHLRARRGTEGVAGACTAQVQLAARLAHGAREQDAAAQGRADAGLLERVLHYDGAAQVDGDANGGGQHRKDAREALQLVLMTADRAVLTANIAGQAANHVDAPGHIRGAVQDGGHEWHGW